MGARNLVALALILGTMPWSLQAQHAEDVAPSVTVATVQLEVTEELYASVQRFETQIDRLLGLARERFDADIVVFPEYTSAFLLAALYPDAVRATDELVDAISEVVGGPVDAQGIEEFLRSHAEPVAATARHVWSRLAARHDLVIVAGTLFEPSDPDVDESALRNRLVVFDEHGEMIYSQDKVYLTSVESEILNIEPGSVAEAHPISIDGLSIGFTICRDSFFDPWEEQLDGIDAWIDLRANGEPYSDEVYRSFLESLPERVEAVGADVGINSSLTGNFLGAVWAGPSYIVDETGTRIAESDDPIGTEITAVRLVYQDGTWEPRVLIDHPTALQ